ncbi:MAG TPA: hypothetical protein VJX92_03240 [Methylomirabilota bacterium]|nr:hypothetical protein [Methylomirabilota bacterium]
MGGRARQRVRLALEGTAAQDPRHGDIYASSSDPIYSTSVDPAAPAVLPWEMDAPTITPAAGPLVDHQPGILIHTGSDAFAEYVMVADPVRELPADAATPPPIVERLEGLSVFIPKSIREPALGDLYEDLERMRTTGCSRAKMWWVVGVQIALLVLARLIPRWLGR